MLFEANDEIRKQIARAESLRLARLREREPFAYLDWVINELEEYHVRGWKRVPKHFVPSLLAIDEIRREGVRVPDRWPALIRDAIDKCFGIQEQILCLRDPERSQAAEASALREPDYGASVEELFAAS